MMPLLPIRPGPRPLPSFNKESRAPLDDSQPLEPGGAEQEPQLPDRVVVDRAVEHDLVAQMAERALDPAPAREGRDGAAGCDGRELPHRGLGLGYVVEDAEREHDVEWAGEVGVEEVRLDQRRAVTEPGEP